MSHLTSYVIVAVLCSTVVLIWVHVVDSARKSTEMIQLLRSIDEKLDSAGTDRRPDDTAHEQGSRERHA